MKAMYGSYVWKHYMKVIYGISVQEQNTGKLCMEVMCGSTTWK